MTSIAWSCLWYYTVNEKSQEDCIDGFLQQEEKKNGKLCLDLISSWEIIAISKSRQMGLRHFAVKKRKKKVIFLDDEETKGFQTGTGGPSAV